VVARVLPRLDYNAAFGIWLVVALVVFGGLTRAYGHAQSEAAAQARLSWTGVDSGKTTVFEVGPGSWEYCPVLANSSVDTQALPPGQYPGKPGMRVSLYSEGGIWLASTSGTGQTGTLKCAAWQGPGRYELRITTQLFLTTQWSIAVHRARTPSPAGSSLETGRASAAELAPYVDYSKRADPQVDGDGVLHFEGLNSLSTAFFQPVGDSWRICSELYPTPPAPNVVSSTPYFNVALQIEDEPTRFGYWDDPATGSSSSCVDVQTTQPVGRHWLIVQEGSHVRGWRLTIQGVKLMK